MTAAREGNFTPSALIANYSTSDKGNQALFALRVCEHVHIEMHLHTIYLAIFCNMCLHVHLGYALCLISTYYTTDGCGSPSEFMGGSL